MQRHIKNYLDYYNKLIHEVNCQICGSYDNIDIHHIEHRQKNNPKLDEWENLIALCRKCHIYAHSNNTFECKQYLKEIINEKY